QKQCEDNPSSPPQCAARTQGGCRGLGPVSRHAIERASNEPAGRPDPLSTEVQGGLIVVRLSGLFLSQLVPACFFRDARNFRPEASGLDETWAVGRKQAQGGLQQS